MTAHDTPPAPRADDTASGRLHDGLETVKEKANHAYESAEATARNAATKAGDVIETNPLGVLVGGLAVGALVGAVLPRSRKEKELLAPIGKRVGITAAAALAAARETGRAELDNLGLTKGGAKDQAKSLFSNVAKAASTAGKAAVEAGREKAKQH